MQRMRSFTPYLVGATVFAVILTVLAINKDIVALIARFDALILVPLMMAIAVSGNVHQPSEVGLLLGFLVQWFFVGLAGGALLWAISSRKRDAAT